MRYACFGRIKCEFSSPENRSSSKQPQTKQKYTVAQAMKANGAECCTKYVVPPWMAQFCLMMETLNYAERSQQCKNKH